MSPPRSKRTDVHRPGALLPGHYESWNTYSLPSAGCPVPIGVDCTTPIPKFDGRGGVTGYTYPKCADTGRCCVASTERHARRDGREIFGHSGKCGVCGAHYVYGSMFKHAPTGAIVHMGHDCADKYEMMYAISAWQLTHDRHEAAHAKTIARERNEQLRESFLAKNAGLAEALALAKLDGSKCERILADMRDRFATYCELSDKQIAFALKLANEIRNPPATNPAEAHVKAPLGKGIEFEGEIVSAKATEGFRGGYAIKITIKVTTSDGVWFAWGTLPNSLAPAWRDASHSVRDLYVGRRVSVKATLELPRPREYDSEGQKRENDGSFVFMIRPSASYVDVYGCTYQVPKCVIGEPCRIIKKHGPGPLSTDPTFEGETLGWYPVICDGTCKNVAKAPRKARKPSIDTAAATM